MAYTKTTTTGYGQRLTGSFKSIGTGFLLFIGATILLFWNEGRFGGKAAKQQQIASDSSSTLNFD